MNVVRVISGEENGKKMLKMSRLGVLLVFLGCKNGKFNENDFLDSKIREFCVLRLKVEIKKDFESF